MSVPAEVAPAKAAGGLPYGSHHLVTITKIYELPGTRPPREAGSFFARVTAAGGQRGVHDFRVAPLPGCGSGKRAPVPKRGASRSLCRGQAAANPLGQSTEPDDVVSVNSVSQSSPPQMAMHAS